MSCSSEHEEEIPQEQRTSSNDQRNLSIPPATSLSTQLFSNLLAYPQKQGMQQGKPLRMNEVAKALEFIYVDD